MHLHTHMCIYHAHMYTTHTHKHHTHAKIAKITFANEHTSLVTLLCWVLLLEESAERRRTWKANFREGVQ